MIWTDCDREGENIGAEVMVVCRKVKPTITVKRARFSAIIAQCVFIIFVCSCIFAKTRVITCVLSRQIHNAAQHPVELDIAQADAVRARIILDLKIGSAFTRLQTMTLQQEFQVLKEIISYGEQWHPYIRCIAQFAPGPCQFPTLGFVVSRYNQVKSFVPENFWFIFLSLTRPASDGQATETVFTWKRGHIFDRNVAMVLMQTASLTNVARVTKVATKDTKKW